MDIVINAAVQSPLFRNLAHIPSDRLAFSHHISSNAPPLSKTKITVEPETAHNSLDADYKFRIPQFGYLNKVIIKLEYDIYPVTRFQVTPLLPMYHLINEISLRSHHRPIQTIFGKEILLKHCYWSDMQDGIAKLAGTLNIPPEGTDTADLREMFKTTTNGVDTLWDPYSVTSWTTNKRRITFFVEVPFASTSAPHVNFDTRFVEHLDVYVRLNSASAEKPLGMACGQMELDLSQPFNEIANPDIVARAVPDRTPIAPIGGKTFVDTAYFGTPWDGNHTAGQNSVETAATATHDEMTDAIGSGATVTNVGTATSGVGGTWTIWDAIDTGQDLKILPGDKIYKITGSTFLSGATLAYAYIGTVKKVLYGVGGRSTGEAHLNAFEFFENKIVTYINNEALYVSRNGRNTGPGGANGLYTTGCITANTTHTSGIINYATKPTALAAATVPGQGKATGHPGKIVDVGSATEFYSTAGILRFNKPGLANAYQGPITTFVNNEVLTTVNSDTVGSIAQISGCRIGTPNQPLTPVHWVRLGCTNYTASDYNGWGHDTDAADNPYDYFKLTNNANAESDARTGAVINADMIAGKFHGAATVVASAATGDSGILSDKFIYNGVTGDSAYSVGARWKDAVLERYYTVFPHLRQASGTANNGTVDWATTAGTGAANTMMDPALTGGKSGSATGIIEGASNISTQYPMNITCSLLCTFLNYHDKIREDISLENYKDDQPATILAWDCVNEQEDLLYGDSSSSYATQPFQEMVLPIKSNHLAYAISVIAFRDLTSAELSNSQARDQSGRSVSIAKESFIGQMAQASSSTIIGETTTTAPRCSFPCYEVVENFKTVLPTYVAVKGSGRPLYEAGVDSNAGTNGVGGPFSSWTSTGKKGRGLGCAGAESDLDNLSYNYNTVEGKGSLQGASSFSDQLLAGANRTVTGNLSDHTSAHIISFGLNPTDELANSGCLALQTVNNPTLHLRFPERYVSHKLPKKCFQELELTNVLHHSPAFTGAASPSSFTTTRSSRLIPTREPSRARSTFNFPNGRGFWSARHATHVRNGRDQQHRRASQDHYACNGDGRGHERLHWRTEKGTCQRFRHLDHLTNGSGQCRRVGRLSYRDRSLPYRSLRDRLEKRFAH